MTGYIIFGVFLFFLAVLFIGGLCQCAKRGDEMLFKESAYEATNQQRDRQTDAEPVAQNLEAGGAESHQQPFAPNSGTALAPSTPASTPLTRTTLPQPSNFNPMNAFPVGRW